MAPWFCDRALAREEHAFHTLCSTHFSSLHLNITQGLPQDILKIQEFAATEPILTYRQEGSSLGDTQMRWFHTSQKSGEFPK